MVGEVGGDALVKERAESRGDCGGEPCSERVRGEGGGLHCAFASLKDGTVAEGSDGGGDGGM